MERLRRENIDVIVLTVFPVGKIELARRPLWSDATLDALRRVNEGLRKLGGSARQLHPAGYEALNKAVEPALRAALEKR